MTTGVEFIVMEVLDEIIEWASNLHLWQQIGVLKALDNDTARETVATLVEYCKQEYDDTDALRAKLGDPLKGFKQAAGSDNTQSVQVTEINSTQNINAIRDGSKITFGDNGLTIVFGSNAVGKSGYSRIFKAACSCRDTEEIHGNIARDEIVDPSATILYKNGGEIEAYDWTKQAPINAPLKTVHIFDTRTARIHLSEKNDVKYVPAGLDIFDKLATLFMQVRQEIQEELVLCRASSPNLELLFSDFTETEIYEQMLNIHDPQYSDKLIKTPTLTAEEIAHINVLRKDIREKDANDPVKRSQNLKLKRERFIRLHNEIIAHQKILKQESFDVIAKLKTNLKEANKIAETAKNKKFDENQLPGTGGALWKLLWQAAEEFSNQSAYHEHKFPFTGDDATCVLCQQPLNEKTKGQFKDFSSFVNDKSQEHARKVMEALTAKTGELLIEHRLDEEEIKACFEELANDEYPEVDALKKLLKDCQESYASALMIAQNVSDFTVVKLTKLNFGPRERFKYHLEKMAAEVEPKDITKYAQELAEQKKKLNALESRQLLDKHRESITKEIDNQKLVKKLSACSSQADTTLISRKGGDLTTKYLGDNLTKTFNEQLQALNRKGLIVELKKSHVERGVAYSEIVIKSDAGGDNGNYRPEDIMSESEQKVASIAGFFTELSLAPHNSAIIFDDPVTSLDELNTARIAKRIVKEAAVRQVIVFTHNLFFTAELLSYVEADSIPFTARTVSKAVYTGQVQDDLPWQALSTKKRIARLNADLQDLGALFNNNKAVEYSVGVKRFYGNLRETWERAVEEILFQDVIKRYSRSVQTLKLKNVTVQESDAQTVEENMTQCSQYAHDPPAGVDSVEIPEPPQLLEDLDNLKKWKNEVVTRSKPK